MTPDIAPNLTNKSYRSLYVSTSDNDLFARRQAIQATISNNILMSNRSLSTNVYMNKTRTSSEMRRLHIKINNFLLMVLSLVIPIIHLVVHLSVNLSCVGLVRWEAVRPCKVAAGTICPARAVSEVSEQFQSIRRIYESILRKRNSNATT